MKKTPRRGRQDNTVGVFAPGAAAGENGDDPAPSRQWPRSSVGRLLMVVAGIVLGQVILLGPSLVGKKTLLPLDYLAQPGIYLPRLAAEKPIVPHNWVLNDLVLQSEMNRQFVVSEVHAGRWPMWIPTQFCGSPFATYAKYSPFVIPTCFVASWIVLAWMPLCVALVTGLGAYVFCRRMLLVGPWPATIAAWCWPLTGFFIFWLGYYPPLSASWLPWLLLAVDATVQRPGGWGALALAAATCLTLVSGQLDVAAQVLLTSGLFAVWRLIDQHGWQDFAPRWNPSAAAGGSQPFRRRMQAAKAIAAGCARGFWSFLARAMLWRQVPALVGGWALGFLLASPFLLPMLEYTQTGARMARRSLGEEERPPVGLAALPQMVLPDMYGSTQKDSLWFPPRDKEKQRDAEGNQLESPSVAYAGLLATLFAMPLAWCSRRRRSIVIFLTALGILGASWCVNLPGVVALLRLPGLNMMSHNRFVFATSFAILSLAAIGLDVLQGGNLRPRRWFWLPMSLSALLLLWCLYRAAVLPEPLATQWQVEVMCGRQVGWVHDLAGLWEVQDTLIRSYGAAAALSAFALAGWLALRFRPVWQRWFLPLLGCLLVADLVWFAYGRPAQCDPALYYPRIPALEEVAKAEPGRIIGFNCLPAELSQSHNLSDVRGYDAVDPMRMVELATIAADSRSRVLPYAITEYMSPKIDWDSSGTMRLSPVLDMLGVRYVIFRGTPPPAIHPDFSSPDYWVKINRRALPRVFVPESVEVTNDKSERLAKLAAADFNPRRVAYVEEPVELPAVCSGSAKIVEEIPTRIKISLDMQTPGLVVLSDLWDAGWHASYDANAIPILRANHAVRGVVVPAGKGTLEFRYEPASFAWGLRLCGLALATMACWGLAVVWIRRRG